MRINFRTLSILSAFVAAAFITTWPAIASASKYAQSAGQKLGISASFGRWPDGVVSYVYNPTDAPAVFADNAYFVALLQDAMAEIEGVSGLTFDYQGIDSNAVLNDFNDGVVAIGWQFLGGAAGLGGPQSSCSGQDIIELGYCQYVDGQVRFNTATAWDKGTADFTERDFLQVAVHELMHLVGIGHSENPLSIMYADPYNNLSHLRADDIDGLQSMYGEPDNFTPAAIYMPPGTGASPLMDSFISTNLNIGAEITEIDGAEPATFAGLSWQAAGVFTDDLTIVATDPHGYYYQGKLDERDCAAGICTIWSSFARVEALQTFPGVWTVYVIINNKLVATESVTVTTNPQFDQAPDSTFVHDTIYGPAPLTVKMTLSVTGDNEGNAVDATWHIPTVGEIALDSGNFPASAGESTQTVTFDKPGEYEVYVEVNDDWQRYGDPAFGDDAGAGFRTLYRRVVRVTKVSDDVTALSDVTSDLVPDLATHVGGYKGKPQINVFSGADGNVDANIRYLTNKWRGIALGTVVDANQDGTADDPAVALLADHKVSRKIVVETRRVDNGAKLGKIVFRNANWRAIDVVVIDDTDGDGNTDDTSIAVLAQHRSNGKIVVEIRSLGSGAPVRNINISNAKWHAIAAAVVDRSAQVQMGSISPLIGVLIENRTSGKRNVESRLVSNGALQRKIKILNSKWAVKDVTVVHDVNGDGTATDPAWQVLAIRNSDKLVRVLTLLVSNGSIESKKLILNSKWEGLRLDSALDMNANVSHELLVAMKKRANNKRRIHVKDYATGSTIRNIHP